MNDIAGINSRLCVFCGKIPEVKTLEHVIPLWLMNFTGELGRNWRFGLDTNTLGDDDPREIVHANTRFAFPACHQCNSEFSSLEGKVKTMFDKLYANSSLTAAEYDTLLDWFDKVRVGTWLGMRYRHKKLKVVPPHFHIKRRIGLKDRMLLVYRVQPDHKGLTVLGTSCPAFLYFPSCFGLLCNGLIFISISKEFLLSPRMGFPFPRKVRNVNGLRLCEEFEAFHYYKLPFVRFSFPAPVLEIYQPILFSVGMMPDEPDVEFKPDYFQDTIDHLKKYYEADFVKERLMPNQKTKGKIHTVSNGSYSIWEPHELIYENNLAPELYRHGTEYVNLVMEIQLWLMKNGRAEYSDNKAMADFFDPLIKCSAVLIKRWKDEYAHLWRRN